MLLGLSSTLGLFATGVSESKTSSFHSLLRWRAACDILKRVRTRVSKENEQKNLFFFWNWRVLASWRRRKRWNSSLFEFVIFLRELVSGSLDLSKACLISVDQESMGGIFSRLFQRLFGKQVRREKSLRVLEAWYSFFFALCVENASVVAWFR